MKLHYTITAEGVLNQETDQIVEACTDPAVCQRWVNRHQQISGVQLSAAQLALIGPGIFSTTPYDPQEWHSCEALDYLRFVTAHPGAKIVEVSSKRTGFWDGKEIAFNKAKTAFHEVLCEPMNLAVNISGGLYASELVRTGFAPRMLCLPLAFSEQQREEMLAAWRHGKQEWYREHAGIALRGRAEAAKQFAVRNPA